MYLFKQLRVQKSMDGRLRLHNAHTFTNPQSLGEKDKALEGHLQKIFVQLLIVYVLTDQAKSFIHILSFTLE